MRIWDIEFGMYSHEIYNLGGLPIVNGNYHAHIVNRGYSGISNQLGMIFGVILWRDFMVISSSNIWSSPRIEMDIRVFMGFMGIFTKQIFPHVNG
jgi:hypothetical protein